MGRTSQVKPVGAALSTVRILRHIAGQAAPITSARVARDLALNPSTCFNILRTLAQEGMVRRPPDSRAFVLGDAAIELARRATRRQAVGSKAQSAMDEFARRYDVTVSLWQVVRERLVLVAAADSQAAMRIQMRIGQRRPLYLGAMGRVMAAYAPVERAQLKTAFASLRWQRRLTFTQYAAECGQARRRGWALDTGTYRQGVVTWAAPLFDDEGVVSHVCCLSAFDRQFARNIYPTIGRLLVGLAQELGATAELPAG